MRRILPLVLFIAFTCAADAAPSVQIAGIADGDTIGGIYYEIEAIAQSSLGIEKVEFYLNDHLFRVETLAPYSFNGDSHGYFFGWDTTIYPNGQYQIRAEAYDSFGDTASATVSFTIFNNRPPTATCTADLDRGFAPVTVQFSGVASDPDGQSLNYTWSFGDGAQSNELNPTHTFTTRGVYIVRFTVADPAGASAYDRLCVRVGLDPILEKDGEVVMQAEDFDMWHDNAQGEEWAIRKDKLGYSGLGLVRHMPDAGKTHDADLDGPAVDYWIDFAQTGRYYIWIRGCAREYGNSCRLFVNGSLAADNLRWDIYDQWKWVSHIGQGGVASIEITEPGINHVTLGGIADGLAVDKIYLTQNAAAVPSGDGPAPSARGLRTSGLRGDANQDQQVNIIDLIFIRNRLGDNVFAGDSSWADINADGKVNIIDLIATRNNLGAKLSPSN